MDDKRFEELRQKVMEASVGISPYGTSPNYGSSSGADPAETLGFLNKQSAHDEEWKAAKAFYNGIVVQGARGITGALKMARDYNVYSRREKDPNYRPMEEGMAILDNMEKSSALQRYDIRANSTLGQFGLDLTEGAGQLLGQVGATALTGGAGGLAIMGTQIAGNQYLDLRNAGVEVPRAAIASLGNAALQAPMEQLSLGKMMKALPAGSSLKKKVVQVLESALTEGTTEFLQQYPEEMANIYAMNKGKDVRQMAAEFDRQFVDITKEAAYSGAIGALLGSGGSSINVALERHAHNAQVEALQGRIDAERKSGINADFLAGTVNTNLQGSTIAVDGETLLQYAQTKNPEEVAKALGIELQEIEKAAEDGLSVDVLQGNFEATELKIPGFLDAVRDEITFSDGGYSVNKEKYQRMLQQETEQIKARDTELQEQLDTIFNSMRDAGANKQTATAMMDMYRAAAVAANPYEPAQYFRYHPVEFRRDGDAANSQTFGNLEYSQAAMKKSEAQSLADFYKEVKNSNVGAQSKGKVFYSITTNAGTTIDVANDDALHFGNKHQLSKEQMADIEANLENIIDYEADKKKKGHYGGITVRAKINTPAGIAGVTLEFLNTGRIFMTTAFFDTEANIENWLNRKEGARTSKLEISNPSAFAGQPSSDGDGRSTLKNSDASFTSQPSISNIQQELEIVKKDSYKQAAFHGSPHEFDKFDLGAIGTGEGVQAHGWGLYFAENRNIADNYREALLQKGKNKVVVSYDGKALDSNNELSFVITHYMGGSELWELATDKNQKLQQHIDRIVKYIRNENSWRNELITILQEQIKKIEDNPRLSITNFLQEAPESEKYRLKSIVEAAKADAKNAGRRSNITDVLQALNRHVEPFINVLERDSHQADLLESTDLNKLKISVSQGATFEVDIPENDVLLDEEKPFSKQSLFVKKALRQLFKDKGYDLTEIMSAYVDKNPVGGVLYGEVKSISGGDAKEASTTLNKYGIKGITYNGLRDGRCFVVFDDQAIKVIERYNQDVNSGETKGGIGWDEAGKAIINLFSEADASTVIHESGHFFVENLARDVNEGRATEQQSKDWQTMLKYAELTNEEWLSMDMEGRRAAHERWAEGFETYIMEGRAPSRELRSVFKKFADWLKAIYEKYKRNTNAVPLNNDVRQVFDRMLASEEDIREMERINGYFSKLPKVITDSLSESSKKRIADYMLKAEDKAIELLTKQSLANFSEGRKERIDAFRADILPQIRDELSKSPLYSACADVEAYTMDTHQKAKTVARRYLYEDGREYANWREELDAVQGDISDRLLPIIEQLQSGMNQGVAFVRDPETGKYVRHSNNDYWYSLWYKQHGRMLTKQDLRQLAYDIYTGERSDVLPGWENDSVEAADHFKDAKAEMDELMQREQELLEQKDDVGKYRYRGLNKEDRITFDLLAERYNYSSGSELAQEIMREPTLERAITLKADVMVQEAFPDIYKERALAEQAAREAFYNDDTGLVIGLEQQLIEDKAAVTLVQERSIEARERLAQARRQQAKLAAKKELTQMSVRDAIRTDRFIAAERKAAAQAATALAKEDYAAALRYKNKQALNHAMARESLLMKDTVNKYKRYINRQFSAKRETWLNDEHFSQAAAIMQRMGFRRRDYDPDMRLASLADYAAKMQDLYDNVDIASWVLNEENSLRNPLQMTFGQFEDVVNALKNIKAIAKANKGNNLLGGAMDYAGYQAEAADNLRKLKTKYKPILGERQTAGYWETFLSSMKNTDNLFEDMDNASYGFFSKTMGSAIKNSNDSEAIHKIKFEERTAAAYREWLPDKAAEEAADHKEYYKELGASADKHTLTKLLMNLGNEGNARVLCTTVPAGIAADSELWVNPGYGVTREEAIEQTKSNLLEFLGKVLTKEDIRYAQKKVDIAGMYWEEMSALDRRTKGFAPRKVEALPVEMMLADGEKVVFRGGYFPLIRDRQMGSSPQGQVPIADTDSQQGRNIRTLSTSNGNLKERVEALYPVDLTRGAEFKIMDNAIHDLCWRETMSDFRKLFNDEHMYGLMKEKLGIAQLQAFREMLEKAAQPNGTASADLAETALSQTASWLRRKTVNAAIMLNMKTAVQNFGNIFLYGRVVEGFGYSDVLTAMGNWHMNLQSAGNYKSMDELIMEKSVFMRERSVLPDITLRDLYAEGKMNKLERQTVKWGTKMLVYTDNLTAKPIWLQAYMKKINSGAGEREAVDFADLVIRRTLGSSRITDVSSLQRGGKLFKLFTTFQGFFNTQFNQWVREANIDMRLWNEGHKGKAALNMTAFVAAKYAVFCLVNLALAFEDPFEEDEDEWLQISKELTHYPLSLMGPIGQAGNALLDQMLGMKSYGYRMSAIQSTIDSSLRMGKKLHKIIADDDPLSDLIEPATGLAGTVIGVPQQLNKWFFNAYDILFNDMDAEFGDVYRRRPKKER